MRKWLSFFRKKSEAGTLQEAEMKLSTAKYPSAQPSAEFKQHLLHQLMAARRHKQPHFSMSHFSFKNLNWKVIVPSVAGALVILLLVPLLAPFVGKESFLLIDRAYAQEAIVITPVQGDISGIEAATSFKLVSKTPLDTKDLKKHLKFSPELAFDINKTSDTEYLIQPTAPLEPATVYNIVVDAAYLSDNGIVIPKEYRFAFQVKDIFKVAATHPGNKGAQVPLKSGIEVTFSHDGVSTDDFRKYFSITPAITGSYKKNGKTIVFVPSQDMKPSTVYHGVIKKGFPLAGTAQQLPEDYTFDFFTSDHSASSTGRSYVKFAYTYKDFQSVPKNTRQVFKLNSYNGETLKNPVFKVFKFKDIDQAINAVYKNPTVPSWVCGGCIDTRVKVEGLTQLYSVQIPEITSYDTTVEMQELKEDGIYVAQLADDEKVFDDLIIQVSSLKAFALGTVTQTLVWVQNGETKLPAKDLSVALMNSSAKTETDEKGVATFDTPFCEEDYQGDVAFVGTAGGRLIVPLDDNCRQKNDLSNIYSSVRSNDYWFAFSSDRSLYLPNDTVHFWGVAQRRTGSAGEKLRVRLSSYDVNKPLLETTVESNGIGSFEGSFDLKYFVPGYYSLYILNEKDEVIGTDFIDISTFQKPMYRFTAVPEKKVVWHGEKVRVNIDATFYDGTPVPSLALKLNSYSKGEESFPDRVVTNDQGHASFIYDTGKKAAQTGYIISSASVGFVPEGIEASENEQSVQFTVINADYNMTLQRFNDHGKEKIKGEVKRFDIEKYTSEHGNYYTSGVPDLPVSVEIIKRVRDVQENERYDDIKKIKTTYKTYDFHDETVGTVKATTDANGVFMVDFPTMTDEYRFSATTKDSKGRTVTDYFYYYPSSSQYSNDEEAYYEVLDQKSIEGKVSSLYKVGEQVNVSLTRNRKPIQNPKGFFLFYGVQNGLMDYAVRTDPNYNFSFAEKNIPNINMGAVWFDGNAFRFTRYEASIQFDTSLRLMDVKVTADKASYKPGEKVVLTVHTTTGSSNSPISADINIKAVDEAIYAIQENYYSSDDPLSELYQSLYGGVLTRFATAPAEDDQEDGGKGGGGDGGGVERSIFKITPLFKTVHTDSAGNASIEFDMPHDITAYRVTAQGVSQNLFAGVGKLSLPVSKDFFGEVTMNTQYTATDKPQIRLRAFGTNLKQDAVVQFEVSAPELGLDKKQFTTKGSQPVWIPLQLSANSMGTHEIRITSTSGDSKDTLIKPVEIVDSFSKIPQSVDKEVVAGMTLSNEDITAPRAELTFALQPFATFAGSLYRMAYGNYGRLDIQVASQRARELLGEHPEHKPLSAYQEVGGALRLFPYGDPDVSVAFKVAGLAKDQLDGATLEQYFDRIIESNKSSLDDVIMALVGKASMKLPVLNDLVLFQTYQGKNLTVKQKLVIAFGFAQLGDSHRANEMLNELLSQMSHIEGKTLVAQFSKSPEENKQLVALAAATAAIADNESAVALFKASAAALPETTTVSVEHILAIDAFMSRGAAVQEGTVTYELNGKKESIDLYRSNRETIQILKEEVPSFKIISVEGPVAVSITNNVPASTMKANTDAFTVARRYEQKGKKTEKFVEGSLVEVYLTPHANGIVRGGLEVTDTLPAGLVPVTSLSYARYASEFKNVRTYPTLIEGQRIVFHAYDNQQIHYTARIVSKGIFVAEPAVIHSSADQSRMNFSVPQTVEIN